MYRETTRALTVSVQPEYLARESRPQDGRYVWAYHVRIENHGAETVQLVRRYWRIVDGGGQVQEVRGAGVVGEQPILRPGESFEYTSGTPLSVPGGFMTGAYEMTTENGDVFEIAIPTFSLDCPGQGARPN
ncbi:MAG: Co2+/Mg2+ efflux protein ApaG [Alphaproteobacteria bacterium]|nr:Co2+/Mg2+ efflux protein ApaG [Alphaproteobacteria bacterium]